MEAAACEPSSLADWDDYINGSKGTSMEKETLLRLTLSFHNEVKKLLAGTILLSLAFWGTNIIVVDCLLSEPPLWAVFSSHMSKVTLLAAMPLILCSASENPWCQTLHRISLCSLSWVQLAVAIGTATLATIYDQKIALLLAAAQLLLAAALGILIASHLRMNKTANAEFIRDNTDG